MKRTERDDELDRAAPKRARSNPFEDRVWLELLQDADVGLLVYARLPVVDAAALLSLDDEPDDARRRAHARTVYTAFIRRDFQSPFGDGLYGFATDILDLYVPRMPAGEGYALASTALAWAATAAFDVLCNLSFSAWLRDWDKVLEFTSEDDTSLPDGPVPPLHTLAGRFRLPLCATSTALTPTMANPFTVGGRLEQFWRSEIHTLALPDFGDEHGVRLEPLHSPIDLRRGGTRRLVYVNKRAVSLPPPDDKPGSAPPQKKKKAPPPPPVLAFDLVCDASGRFVHIKLVAVHVERLLAAAPAYAARAPMAIAPLYQTFGPRRPLPDIVALHVRALLGVGPNQDLPADGLADALRELATAPGELPLFMTRQDGLL